MLCQVTVSGTDSKAIKSTYAAFHTFKNGRTTLSTSGILLHIPSSISPGHPTAGGICAIAPLAVLYPFLQQAARSKLNHAKSSSLLPSVQINLSFRTGAASHSDQLFTAPATFLATVHLPPVQAAAEGLLSQLNSSFNPSWKLGWYLADQQPAESATPELFSCWALLQLQPGSHAISQQPSAATTLLWGPIGNSSKQQQQEEQWGVTTGATRASPALDVCSQPYLGQPLVIWGSPFGCLAPYHFYGAQAAGWVSNTLHKLDSSLSSLSHSNSSSNSSNNSSSNSSNNSSNNSSSNSSNNSSSNSSNNSSSNSSNNSSSNSSNNSSSNSSSSSRLPGYGVSSAAHDTSGNVVVPAVRGSSSRECDNDLSCSSEKNESHSNNSSSCSCNCGCSNSSCSSSSSSNRISPSCEAAAGGGVAGSSSPLFLVDAACHPGMEGGPINCRCVGVNQGA